MLYCEIDEEKMNRGRRLRELETEEEDVTTIGV